MDQEYIEVDFYVMGVYHGKRRIHRNSICGLALTGQDVAPRLEQMADELNAIPGVTAQAAADAVARARGEGGD